mgnify:FL=1
MKITGDNLLLVRMALDGAISDIQAHIGSCPDVNEYAADLLEYEQEKQRFERFAVKVDAAIKREEAKRGAQ